MKHSNLVIGGQVQAKRTHTDPSRPALTLAEGAVFTVEYVFCDPATGFRLSGETLGVEYSYGQAENFRKYKEPEPLKVGDIVELAEDCTARHGEAIPKGLYIVGSGSNYPNCVQLDTHHGGLDLATVKTKLLTKVGVCTVVNG